ncbi:AraC family transcriptional regulator [Ferruginibacter sp.]|uniref:helix-turn-helix domain-containing protein n=1 Tax=Ferruginibacter sp. TaxID=1940288 RepID=UPI00198A2BA7|nr:helix-turn-helix domain-containing protein [Ferruginibacter sp.]MBC7627122.1 AraC family transcriptional regulator [Ferruginibacter sp.]
MKLFIKNMVCLRCKMLVKAECEKIGLHSFTVYLGEVDILENITVEETQQLKLALLKSGLELMDDKKAMLLEKIKTVIVEMVHYTDELPIINFSAYLSEKLNYNYSYLAHLFSETEGMTLEHFIILHKIERVKQLIIYDELSFTEIAWKLHYSSMAHLSYQFRKVTGLTPSLFRSMEDKRRGNLENV